LARKVNGGKREEAEGKDQHIPVAYESTFFLCLPLKKNRTIFFEFIGKFNRSASFDFK
jgi:hypothetical protein